jgi:hypothetical protein
MQDLCDLCVSAVKPIFSHLLSDGSRQSKSAIQIFLWQTLLVWQDPSLTLRALTFCRRPGRTGR